MSNVALLPKKHCKQSNKTKGKVMTIAVKRKKKSANKATH